MALPRIFVWTRRIAKFPIHVYRKTLSWLMGGQCRFTPTCSQYGLDAIDEWGAVRGWAMAIWRVLRCNPFCAGGHDPAPKNPKLRERESSGESPV